MSAATTVTATFDVRTFGIDGEQGGDGWRDGDEYAGGDFVRGELLGELPSGSAVTLTAAPLPDPTSPAGAAAGARGPARAR